MLRWTDAVRAASAGSRFSGHGDDSRGRIVVSEKWWLDERLLKVACIGVSCVFRESDFLTSEAWTIPAHTSLM